ncbi:MAG: hypothetical protein IKV99_00295 [Oscillospiraceae bacterium]|nr:hypothetical protein [Oscillospiraceae bacterium]
MKKFFSLVLALVMALSLTTIAWGAYTGTGTADDPYVVGTTDDLTDVLSVAADGSVIKLTADIARSTGGLITVNGMALTFDLGGKTLSRDVSSIFYVINGGKLTVKNGTLTCTCTDNAAIYSDGNGTDANSITLDGVTLNSKYMGVYHNGTSYGANVTINNSAIVDTYAEGAGVFLSGQATWANKNALTITNSNISGATAVEVKQSDATVTNSTLTSTYTGTASLSSNGNGMCAVGYALALTNNATDATAGTVTVNSGTFKGAVGIKDSATTNEVGNATGATIAVKGGTFTDDVISYLASGSVYKDGVVTTQTTVPTTGTTSTGSVTTGSVTAAKAKLYRLATAGGSMTELGAVTEIKLTSVAGKIDANVPKYVPNIYSLDGNLYIQVAKAAADYALKNNGTYIYLFDIPQTTTDAAIAAYATSVVMDKLVTPADTDIDCGDCIKGGALASYYVSGTNFYYTDGLTWAYFNGEFVKYDATTKVVFQDHTWDATSIKVKATDVKGTKVPVTIECKDCEKTFSIVGAKAFDNTWVKGVNYTTTPAVDAYGQYYIVLSNASTGTVVAPSTDKTVQSAQTFDAGIAMYVGMSVMAAAGGAVVLKKRED